MKLSKKIIDKNKVISIIKKFFETEIIEETARDTNFVQREGKLNAVNFFFSVC